MGNASTIKSIDKTLFLKTGIVHRVAVQRRQPTIGAH